MKRIITLALSMVFAMTAFGQRLGYESTSNWFLGLNAGATWNTTDVQNKTYAGWGFLLGRSYNYDYGRKFSYDLRFRYLRGKWYGQDTDSTNLSHLGANYTGALADYKNNLGYTVNNYEANVHELGLELAVHLNRFRDRTGWDPYIFGGANIVWNETYGDLLNQDFFLASPEPYAYDQIDMTKPALEFAMDQNYETALDGTTAGRFNVNFMPSLGIGLGYDFGPRFSMGIEHKTTFALKDDFDGYVDAEPNWGFLKNDVYHYTNAFMRFRFGGRGSVNTNTTTTPTQTNQNTTSNVPCQFPDVRTTRPLQRTETVEVQSYVFRAEVRFVQSRNQIVMRVNGVQTTNFLYNPDNHQLESNLILLPGNNTIEITGTNGCGSDTETTTIVYNNCIDPIVNFQNVSNNAAQVEQQAYAVRAQISNATSVQFTVNGIQSTNFTYSSATGQFTSNISLNQGQNTIRIVAINACGTDTESIVVTYTDCADPMVNFANGNNGIVSVSQANFNLSAYVYNVTSKNNITVRVNGATKTFSYSTSSRLLTASLALNQGQNTIQITATTNCGTDTETLTVNYTPCVSPTIQMIQPLGQNSTSTNGTQLIQATVYNVANVNQIQLTVNGNLQPGGSFNPVTRLFEATVALNSGFNTIQLTVLNDCGSDREAISVNYNPCNTPDVQLIFPASSGGSVSSPSQLVQAMIFNVNGVNEIQTFVNGNLQSGGTYSSVNGLYQNTVGLSLGLNTIQVVATNSCGSDVQTVMVTYRTCDAPTVTFLTPNRNPFFTNTTSMSVSAAVGGVTSASQITLMVNGVVDASGALFNSGSSTYTNNISLNVGNNVIQITATNSCGTTTKEINVVREVVIVDTPNEDEDSIVICYVNSNNVGAPVTMTIPLSSWPAYQQQGAQLGPCPIIVEPVDEPLIICYPINGTPTTVQILTSEWPAYQALGGTLGACPVQTMNVCLNGNQVTIPVSQWSIYQGQGATEGPCPVIVEDSIVICHRPPGNPTNTQELTIPLSAWAAHQAHGDVLGPCPVVDPEMLICLNGTQQTILTSQWASYQTQGATQGPCPIEDPDMTICMLVGDVYTTMTILTSQWPTYQAQGATQGPCVQDPDPMMTICLEVNGVPTTMEILTSEWARYRVKGATQGPCVIVQKMKICLNGNTLEIPVTEWARYQGQGAQIGPCLGGVDNGVIEIGNEGIQNTDTLNGNIGRPVINGGGNDGGNDGGNVGGDDELLFGNTMITICHTPQGSISSQTIQIPMSEWQAYQQNGASLGPCAGSLQNGGNSGTINVNSTGTGNQNGVGGVPINPNNGGGDPSGGDPTGGNMQQMGNGSQQATGEQLKSQQEAAAEKARLEQAAKEAAAKKAATDEKARQEQAIKDAAAKKAAEQEEAKRKAADAQAEKTRQENALKEAAAKKAAEQEAVRRQAEEAKRKAAEAEAAKARQEQAAKEAAAKKAADQAAARQKAEEAKRKAAEAEAAKARQEQAAKEAAAKKAAEQEAAEEAKRKAAKTEKVRQEQAIKDAAAKKAAEEAARKKAEEQRKMKESEGGR